MKFTTLSRRTAAAGAASALIAGALVGATTTAAQAAEITNTYACAGPSGDFSVTLKSDIPILVNFPQIAAGFDVGAGLLDVANEFIIPEAVINGLGAFGVTRVDVPDFAGAVSGTEVAIEGVGADVADAQDNGDGTYSFDAPGINTAFEVPSVGTYDIVGPDGFTLAAKNESGATVLNVPCTLTSANGIYHTLVVTKNASESSATAVNSPVQKGDVAKVKVKVAGPDFQTPSGKVVLKNAAGRTLDSRMLNARGVATLKFVAKTLGKNKLTAIYKGDGYTTSSRTSVVVKVVR